MTDDQPKRRPGVRSDTGILRDRQWAALVRLWQAGDTGIERDTLFYGRGGFTWMPTLRRLQEYLTGPLMEHFKPNQEAYSVWYRITEAGKTFYCEQWQYYRKRYPDVEAPDPRNDSSSHP